MELFFIYTKKDEFTKGTGVRVFAECLLVSTTSKVEVGEVYTPRFEDSIFFSSYADAKIHLDVTNEEVIDSIDSTHLSFEPFIYGQEVISNSRGVKMLIQTGELK